MYEENVNDQQQREKEGRRLIFADESVYENAEAGYYGGTLFLFMMDTVTLQEASMLAFNTSKTQSIIFEYGGMSDTYVGYTQVISLSADLEQKVTIQLKRGE